jgi:hypothetical protein
MLISPSLNVSVSFKFASVLFTTVSTTKTSNCTALAASAVPAVLKGSRSSAITGLEYELVSGGALRMSSSALEGTDTPPAARRAKHAAHATVRASLHSASCFIVVSSHKGRDPPLTGGVMHNRPSDAGGYVLSLVKPLP